jgi:3-oxoacyl-[acyl-carrier-protein] synthase III
MIAAISSYLPAKRLENEELASLFPEWPVEKIYEKTGIRTRRIAEPNVTAADLAFEAAESVLQGVDRNSLGFLLFCTQSPDYLLPASACILQHRLKLPTTAGALDFNLGCSGFIYGLALAQSLIQSSLAKNVLLLTADTYSKYIHPLDKSARTIFGDAGAATLLRSDSPHRLHSFVLRTDGSGADRLMIKVGGSRYPVGSVPELETADHSGNVRSPGSLAMDGPEVFNFTLQQVPALVGEVLAKAQLSIDQIDLFVFHQANAFMLEHLRRKLGIPAEKFVLCLEHCGNTVSATIPIALESTLRDGRLKPSSRVLLAGFGVGFSWGGCILEWN